MQTITRPEIERIGQIYLSLVRGELRPEDLVWVCESLPRSQWLDEMMYSGVHITPDSPTYGVIQ